MDYHQKEKNEEVFGYCDLEVSRRVLSEIREGSFAIETTGFKCPLCSTINPILEHGAKTKCIKCGLQMQLFGNGLHCVIPAVSKGVDFNKVMDELGKMVDPVLSRNNGRPQTEPLDKPMVMPPL